MGRDNAATRQMTLVAFLQAANCSNYPASWRHLATAPDFLTGIRLVDDVALVAETMDHHPDIDILWRTLTFTLSTHSAGGVTAADFELARGIDEASERHGAE